MARGKGANESADESAHGGKTLGTQACTGTPRRRAWGALALAGLLMVGVSAIALCPPAAQAASHSRRHGTPEVSVDMGALDDLPPEAVPPQVNPSVTILPESELLVPAPEPGAVQGAAQGGVIHLHPPRSRSSHAHPPREKHHLVRKHAPARPHHRAEKPKAHTSKAHTPKVHTPKAHTPKVLHAPKVHPAEPVTPRLEKPKAEAPKSYQPLAHQPSPTPPAPGSLKAPPMAVPAAPPPPPVMAPEAPINPPPTPLPPPAAPRQAPASPPPASPAPQAGGPTNLLKPEVTPAPPKAAKPEARTATPQTKAAPQAAAAPAAITAPTPAATPAATLATAPAHAPQPAAITASAQPSGPAPAPAPAKTGGATTLVSAVPPVEPPALSGFDMSAAKTPAAEPVSAAKTAPTRVERRPGGGLRFLFPVGGADLSPAAREALTALARTLDSQKSARIEVDAYATPIGDGPSSARRLSLSRALALRGFLIEKGLDSTRIDVRALGDKPGPGPLDRVDVSLLGR